MRHVAVVIEVIPRQVGKRRSGDRQTVEPELVEAVTRSFDRHVLDASPGQLGEIAVQRHGIGGRQRAGPAFGGGHQPERAEARRRLAEGRPDLAREMDHRGLAVGAGNGGNRSRLPAVQARCHQRQAAVRVRVGHDADPVALLRRKRKRVRIVGQDGRRAARHSVGGETASVLSGAGQRREQKAGLHGPRIGGEPDDLRVVQSSKGRHGGHQLSKFQAACPAGFRPSAPAGSRARLRRPAAPQRAAPCVGLSGWSQGRPSSPR